jgi:CheY-like chemotaxis protein
VGVLLLCAGLGLLVRRRYRATLHRELQRCQQAEIRTPMYGVLGMAEILLRSELTSEQRAQVKLIQTSAESLLSLVNGVLERSRTEAERLRLRPPGMRAQGSGAPIRTPASDLLDEARRPVRGARSILVVDDRDTNRTVALALLRELGFTAEAVESGAEALERLAQRPFDAMLLDCEMPGFDGFETCRQWRAQEADRRLPRLPRLPIIAVTAYTEPEEIDACLAAGMDDYLAKPFRIAELAAVLDRWLEVDAAAPPDAMPREPDGDGLAARLAAWRALEEKTGKPVVADFLRQGEEDLAAVRRALPQEDAQTVAKAAHALSGSAGMLGATALAETAGEIAVLARRGDLSGCAAHLPALEQAWRETAASLQP